MKRMITGLAMAAALAAATACTSMCYAAEVEQTVDHMETVADNWEYCGVYRCSFYCSCVSCCGKSDGITASGSHVQQGRTVATGKEFPFGTQLLIDGHIYTVEDRGVGNGHIDIFMDSHQECLQNGVQYHEVYVRR